MYKKCLATILAFVILLGMMPVVPFGIEAEAATYPTTYPNTHINTGNMANDIVEVAKTQCGYVEGDGNATKYNAWYVQNTGKGSVNMAWCASFVSWCANQAGVPETILPSFSGCTEAYAKILPNAGCNMYSRNSGYTPKRGDLIFFDYENDLVLNHVGIVDYVEGSRVHYINGNTTSGNDVRYASCSLTYGELYGYASPRYIGTPTLSINYTAPNGGNSEFSWSASQNATGYNLRIFDTDLNEEVEFSQWHLSETSCSVRLPQGNYRAVVDAYNDSGYVNSNTVYFTVPEGHYVPWSTRYHDGHIYSLYTEMHTWAEAKELCEKIGGHLVTITSEEEDEAVAGLCSSNPSEYWIGLTDEKTENSWEWVTGEALSYDHWQPSQPDNWDGLEHYGSCVPDMAWNDLPASARRGFICEFDVSDWEPTTTTYYGGSKYEFYSNSVSWTTARVFAESKGGHLPYVTSAEEDAAIHQLVMENTEYDCWLGASDYGRTENDFVWNDGSALNYENWNEGEPNNTKASEHFLNMVTASGKWNDHNQRGGHTGDYTGLEFVIEYDNIDMSITLDKSSAEMEIDGTLQLTAQVNPADLPVDWVSSDEDVATVSDNGLVTAKSAGSTVITVRYGDVSASCEVTVMENSALTGIEITTLPDKVSYCVGDTIDTTGMVVTASYESGVISRVYTGYELEYDFSKTGTKTVKVTYQDKSATFTVTVNNEWITELPEGANPEDYESITQYSGRGKEFTTSGSGSLDGWIQYDSATGNGEWSDWTDSFIAASDSVQVEIRTVEATPGKTQYMFFSYRKNTGGDWHFCPVLGDGAESSWVLINSGWLDYMLTSTGKTWSHGDCGSSLCYCPNTNVVGKLNTYYDSRYNYDETDKYYWYTTRWVEPTYKTQYRSRSVDTTYYYYKWSDWSEWQDETITAADTTEVRTRTLYRLKLVEEELTFLTIPAQFSGASGKTEATIVFTPTDGGEAISAAVGYSSDIKGGVFSVELPEGEYSVKVTKPGHTTYTISSFTVGTDNVPQDIIIYAGDINGDGFINAKDNAILTATFGSRASDENSNYNAAADFNEDGFINAKDRAIIIANFGKRNVTA